MMMLSQAMTAKSKAKSVAEQKRQIDCPPCYYTWDRKIWDHCPYPYPKNWNGKASTVPPGSYYYNGNQYIKRQSNRQQMSIQSSDIILDGTPTINGKSVIRPETFRNIDNSSKHSK